jgi:hypothetical protein
MEKVKLNFGWEVEIVQTPAAISIRLYHDGVFKKRFDHYTK